MPRALVRRVTVARAFADARCAVVGTLPNRVRRFGAGHDDRRLQFLQPFR
jgi:hypothetical protein